MCLLQKSQFSHLSASGDDNSDRGEGGDGVVGVGGDESTWHFPGSRWLGLHISTAGVWVPSLVWELGSCMKYGLAKRKKNLNVVIMMVMRPYSGGDGG